MHILWPPKIRTLKVHPSLLSPFFLSFRIQPTWSLLSRKEGRERESRKVADVPTYESRIITVLPLEYCYWK